MFASLAITSSICRGRVSVERGVSKIEVDRSKRVRICLVLKTNLAPLRLESEKERLQ